MSDAPANGSTTRDSFAAILAKFATENGVPQDKAPDASAAAVYLAPHLERLAALERGCGAFPTSPDAGPWADIENEVLDPRTRESVLSIGTRYGTRRQHLYAMSKRRKWPQRRAALLEMHARQTTAAALMAPARAIGKVTRRLVADDNEQRFLGLIDRALRVFEVGLENGQVQIRTARDLDVLVRLTKHLQGYADRTVEHRDRITPQELERRAAKVARRMDLDATMAGIVEADYTLIAEDDDLPDTASVDSGETDPGPSPDGADGAGQNPGTPPSSGGGAGDGSDDGSSSIPDSSPRSSASQ